MSLTVAVQMDPLESIGIAGDSTFALMLSAQARGHCLFHYAADALTYEDGRVRAMARAVTVQKVAGNHFTAAEAAPIDLGRDVDFRADVRSSGCATSFESSMGDRLVFLSHRAIGAVVARFVHTEEVTGSNPVSPTRITAGQSR